MTAAVGWIAFVLLPGAALALCVAPTLARRPVLLIAVSPALAFALSWGVAGLLELTGHGPWPGLAVTDGAVISLAALRLHLAGSSGLLRVPMAGNTEEAVDAEARRAGWLLVAAVLLGLAAWVLPGSPSVPANRDVQNHGYFVARIAHENSVDTDVVLADSPTNPTPAADFYPLAAHTTMAVAERAGSTPVPDLLVVWPLMASVVTLPCGLFALTRRLLPRRPAVAGWAALAGVGTALFPYQPMMWGGIAFVVGMASVPGVLALALTAVDTPRQTPQDRWLVRFRTGDTADPVAASLLLLTAIAVAGTTLAHTSELALLGIFLAAFATSDLVRGRRAQIRGASASDDAVTSSPIPPTPMSNPAECRGVARSLRRWGLLAGLCVVILVPMLAPMANGAGERTNHEEVIDEGPLDVLWRLIALDVDEGPVQVLSGVLGAVGVAIVIARRRRTDPGRLYSLLAGLAVLALLFTSLTLGGAAWEPLRALTFPWYRSWWRLPYNLALFAPVFVGVTLDAAHRAIAGHVPPTRRPAAAMAVAVFFALVALPGVTQVLQSAGVRRELLSADETAMIADLARRTGDSHDDARVTVLNQENDGTSWMYALEGLPAFSGVGRASTADRSDPRQWLLDHADDLATDPRVADLYRRFGIGYVLVGGYTYSEEPAQLDPSELSKIEDLELIDREGSLWLFEVRQ